LKNSFKQFSFADIILYEEYNVIQEYGAASAFGHGVAETGMVRLESGQAFWRNTGCGLTVENGVSAAWSGCPEIHPTHRPSIQTDRQPVEASGKASTTKSRKAWLCQRLLDIAAGRCGNPKTLWHIIRCL
jgi:hypothetical protein